MHIEVNQATQQVAANRGRKWLQEEIDWVLNKMQDRFISSCLRPRPDGSGGFELDQIKAEHIRMLVTNASLIPYIETERYKCFLPADYEYLIADWSYSEDLCAGAITPTVASKTLFITRLLQSRSAKEASPFYETLSLMMPDGSVQVPADLPLGHAYAGYPELTDISFLTPWLLWKLKNTYWERFDDLYYPSHFISVRDSAYGGAVAITIDGDVYTDEIVTTKALTYHTAVHSAKRHNNRLMASEIISSANESQYWRSAHYSPISELQGPNLYIHRDNSFTVSGVGITYIRKPQPISLSLNTDCELAGSKTHQIICDLATEYLKSTVQNAEGKALKTADIVERVTI